MKIVSGATLLWGEETKLSVKSVNNKLNILVDTFSNNQHFAQFFAAEGQTIHRALPPMSPNPIYESSTPLYDVIPDNLACKLQADKEMTKPILPEDSTRLKNHSHTLF